MSNTRKEIFEKIYERCFKFGSCNYKETGCSDCPIHVTLVKAETLLDKEEQGLLIELPCKVGDSVYLADKFCNKVKESTVEQIEYIVNIDADFSLAKIKGKGFSIFFDDFGKLAFLTRSEAEEALAKMGGTNENTD